METMVSNLHRDISVGIDECIIGSNHKDVIIGGDGDDLIEGKKGDDNLQGRFNNDRIIGDKVMTLYKEDQAVIIYMVKTMMT